MTRKRCRTCRQLIQWVDEVGVLLHDTPPTDGHAVDADVRFCPMCDRVIDTEASICQRCAP